MADPQVTVVGGGPAGLMAAETLAKAGVAVTIYEAMPTVGRKFLMAGKSGLNITKDEPDAAFLRGFYEAAPHIAPMVSVMGPAAVTRFVEGLGQPVFIGSSGRVFPKAMKASPLLRAWLARLSSLGVTVRTRWRWTGFDEARGLTFETPSGPQTVSAAAVVLALGGASWSRLGSDGAWAPWLEAAGVPMAGFAPANMALRVSWSAAMAPQFGAPVKPVTLRCGDIQHRGEFVISEQGVEGSGIYALARQAREGAPLTVDLVPDLTLEEVAKRLASARPSDSLPNRLRKALGLDGARRALLFECGKPLPREADALAAQIKALTIPHLGAGPLDEAISVAGGVRWSGLTGDLMLNALPGVFCAGEMLDWEAPTGGYLITGCLATGRWTGEAAGRWAIA
ncbi:MAG: TIGR03862 family flavoprotein [Devosiaceae bacterium]|nr:TIGR03862 family flavoprotein [Devosiaceae bacterium MH13]